MDIRRDSLFLHVELSAIASSFAYWAGRIWSDNQFQAYSSNRLFRFELEAYALLFSPHDYAAPADIVDRYDQHAAFRHADWTGDFERSARSREIADDAVNASSRL